MSCTASSVRARLACPATAESATNWEEETKIAGVWLVKHVGPPPVVTLRHLILLASRYKPGENN